MGRLGPKWATLAGLRLGQRGKIKKMSWAAKAIGTNWQWLQKILFTIFKQRFEFLNQEFKCI
jgi:hypothetical protein